jgi:hypothetical protein
MTFEIVRDILGWCALIHIGFLLWWAVAILFLHDFVYRMHSRWFKMSVEEFDKIHYTGIAFYKIAVFLTCLVPYLAMRIVG